MTPDNTQGELVPETSTVFLCPSQKGLGQRKGVSGTSLPPPNQHRGSLHWPGFEILKCHTFIGRCSVKEV